MNFCEISMKIEFCKSQLIRQGNLIPFQQECMDLKTGHRLETGLRGSEDYMLQLLLPANIKPLCTLVIINAGSPKYGSASCNNAPVSRSELRPGETKMQVHISELEQAP